MSEKKFGTKFTRNLNEKAKKLIYRRVSKKKNKNVSIPDRFDSRIQWPGKIGKPLDQGNCESCWAFSTLQAFSDRVRIKNNMLMNDIDFQGKKIKDTLSPYYLTACNFCSMNEEIPEKYMNIGFSEKEICDMSCTGGYVPHAQLYLNVHGVIPLSDDPLRNYDYNSYRNKVCPNNEYMVVYKSSEFYPVISHQYPKHQKHIDDNVKNMQLEIMENGPIVSGYVVYENHLDGFNKNGSSAFTKNGLYYNIEGGKEDGNGVDGHAICIIGWGDEYVSEIDKTVPYWICRNSYASKNCLPTDEYFRMPRGFNFCDIESEVWASIP